MEKNAQQDQSHSTIKLTKAKCPKVSNFDVFGLKNGQIWTKKTAQWDKKHGPFCPTLDPKMDLKFNFSSTVHSGVWNQKSEFLPFEFWGEN